MLKTRYTLIFLAMLLYPLASSADVSVSIGINLPVYPNLVVVPGYPVYYAPQLQANFFFYDGMYWVYRKKGRKARTPRSSQSRIGAGIAMINASRIIHRPGVRNIMTGKMFAGSFFIAASADLCCIADNAS